MTRIYGANRKSLNLTATNPSAMTGVWYQYNMGWEELQQGSKHIVPKKGAKAVGFVNSNDINGMFILR